ncbi:hypothetical protein [Haliovirga abyssi]|uniref:Uncharacterized protein n=1 Tax=Haliovirga abyssi TaxID=2996794 RepID=A0AAU9DWW4_9FUSO|nr:hypothetical protein [Haliovirga abyssi]BDU50821.1 hypothetical protein HLVA_13900 [Haliovirga abyssi]
MKNKLKQIYCLLKMNIKIEHKRILILGVFSYVAIVILSFLNPITVDWVFRVNYFTAMSKIDMFIIIGAKIAWIFNISAGVFFMLKNFIREKRYFYLLPFDLDVKIYSVYLYSFIWIILNTAIYFLLIMIFGNDLNDSYGFTIPLLKVIDVIYYGLIYLNLITYAIIYYIVKKNNSTIYNFAFLWITTILENIFIKKLQYFFSYKGIYGMNQTLIVFSINFILLGTILYFISKRQNIKG